MMIMIFIFMIIMTIIIMLTCGNTCSWTLFIRLHIPVRQAGLIFYDNIYQNRMNNDYSKNDFTEKLQKKLLKKSLTKLTFPASLALSASR